MSNTPNEPYRIERALCEGPTTTLSRALRIRDRARVLIKVPRSEYPTRRETAMLEHERSLLDSLRDVPGIARPIGVEKVGDRMGLVMEDVAGEPLSSAVDPRRPLPLRDFLRVGTALAEILARVHDHGIIHKDVTPQRFLWNRDTGALTLVDFSLATLLSEEVLRATSFDRLEGTLAYMSPEQTGRMNRKVDRRSDLYSLGVTLYELATGVLPFPQSSDPLELIHSHIARVPPAAHEITRGVPPALSAILSKLLAKVAEERYQSAAGVRADLQTCLDLVERGAAIESFPLGRGEVSDELRIPQKLYGREAETAALLAAFERAQQGTAGMLLVSGYSGVGKSALVGEIHKLIVRRGRFITGKFDQLHRNTPYAPIAKACRDLVRSILAEPAAALATWKEQLQNALSPNGQLLVDLIPELELVIGPQPAVSSLGPSESQHRFELVFQRFLRVFMTADHPLAFFLDDLQWADPGSLRLIQQILTGQKRGHLLLIGAYRDNEVDPLHPVTVALQELSQAGAIVGELKLAPLGIVDVTRLLCDTLGSGEAEVRPLADLLLSKTGGNPFFLNQFLTTLYKDKLLAFDAGKRAWVWDLQRIEGTMATDNVVDFMIAKLRQLPPGTQHVLRLAACIGHQFDRNTLAVICQRSLAEVAADVWTVLREGLLVPVDTGHAYLHHQGGDAAEADLDANPTYRFLHDRVQQAASALIDEAEKPLVHLRVGRLLLQNAGDALEDKLFDIVGQMTAGAALVVDPAERRTVARLTLQAGRKARDAAAYDAAAKFLATCLELLGAGAWESDYEVAREAHLIKAECELMSGRTEEAFRLLDEVERHARNPIDNAAPRDLRTLIFTAMNRMGEAAACGVEAARLLGMDFPTDDAGLGPAIGAEMGALGAALAGRSIESLIDLPEMTDPKALELVRLLYRVVPAATQTKPPLMVLIVAKAVNLALRHGNSPISSYFYICCGLVHAFQGDVETAYRFGQLGIQLAERMGNRAVDSANHFVFAAFIAYWRSHLSETLGYFQRGLRFGLDAGDYLHASYSASFQVGHRLFMGDALDEIAAALPGAQELLERTGDVVCLRAVRILGQLVANLKGRTVSRESLEGEGFDAAECERAIGESGNRYLISSYYLFRAIARYLAGNPSGAAEDIVTANPASPGNFWGPEIVFFRALIWAARLRELSGEGREALVAELEKDEATLRGWAGSSPANFAHRHALVKAELAALTADGAGAVELYDRAIELAQQGGSLLVEALGSELCSAHLAARGRARLARMYLAEAHQIYRRWGATTKAEEIAARLPAERREADGGVSAGQLETLSVIKASQAISTEIVLPKLVSSLMRIVIEQAGAERGFLLVVRGTELWAEGSAGTAAAGAAGAPFQRFRVDSTGAGGEAEMLPRAIIDFVQRTREKVLLSRADEENIFSADPYFQRRQPRSLLCLPMLRQGQLVGLLYLENSLTSGAFSPDRVAVLEVLSAQAAISLENATLYEEMELRVQERTRDLEASLQLIKENQAQLIEAERKAAVAQFESEMNIAQHIQTSILPKGLAVPGFELAARMATATSVGGDYYDVHPTDDGGCWIGIGDVSGHGIPAGLMMLMIQSGLSSLMRRDPQADPSTLLALLNRMLYENVRKRLGRDDFATLSLLRFQPDGRFALAGAHEELVVWRAALGRCERIPTPGTWLGSMVDVEPHLSTRFHRLETGDLLLLYTDGITEAMASSGEQFGIERLDQLLDRVHGAPVAAICDQLFAEVDAFSATPRPDDQTALIIRFDGTSLPQRSMS
jgi:predicted ATPase/serine phosphatase RsbU (regulator of sigma subunit)/tRNA A-37 threonylcarbamoyl transferase component Bud32